MVLQQSYHTEITDNVISDGTLSDGVTSTNYKYDVHVYGASSGNFFIDGNEFTNILAVGDTNAVLNTFITMPSTTIKHRITNNKFVRGGASSILSYINAANKDCVITNNHFDNFTIDGTNETLVAGLSGTTSVYMYNTNQIIYVAVPYGSFSVNTISTSADITTGTNIDVTVDNGYVQFFIDATGAKTFQGYFNLNAALPDGVKILDTKLGMYAINFGSTLSASNSISYELSARDIVTANYSAGTNSILDVKNKSGTTAATVSSATYDIDVNFASLTSATQYLSADASSDLAFFNNTAQYNIDCVIFLSLNLSVAGGGMSFFLSPFVLRCIW